VYVYMHIHICILYIYIFCILSTSETSIRPASPASIGNRLRL